MKLNAKGFGASLTILSAAALLSLVGCKDDKVDIEVGCETEQDCPGDQICNAAKVCVERPVDDAVCGDGKVEGAEQCDDGAENSDTEADACRTDCTKARCGDGVVDAGEACDEGAEGNDGVTCSSTCSLPIEAATYNVRVESVALLEPAMHRPVDDVCKDDSELLNGLINGYVATGTLNIVQLLEFPLAAAGEEFTAQMGFPSSCDSSACEIVEADAVTWKLVQPTDAGACFARVPAEATAAGWLDNVENELLTAEIPVQGDNVCLQGTTEGTFVLSLMGMDAKLQGVHASYEVDRTGDAPAVERGVIAGFITEADAEALKFNAGNERSLAFLLSGGEDNCVEEADRVELDKGPNADGEIVDGWWMYVALTGDSVIAVSGD